MILSASSMVDSRWAMDMLVWFFKIGFKFSNTIFSVSVSRALVDSSSSNKVGFLSRHLDRANLCF